jgi:hypothetical protein
VEYPFFFPPFGSHRRASGCAKGSVCWRETHARDHVEESVIRATAKKHREEEEEETRKPMS